MNSKKKRLTLDLDPSMQRQLKSVAALKGISMRQYCQTAIEKELARDQAQGVDSLPFGPEAIDRFAELQAEIFGDKIMPGDSAEFIRETRASRAEL